MYQLVTTKAVKASPKALLASNLIVPFTAIPSCTNLYSDDDLIVKLCLNPKTRKLIQLQWSDDLPDKCEQIMGKDSLYRKELLGVK